MVAFWWSSFNIGILTVALIFYSWFKFLKSKNLLIPKIDKYGGVESSSYRVSYSFWVFIGSVLGLYLVIFLNFVGILSMLSIIGNNLPFNRARFDIVYAHLLYPGFHVIVYTLGFFGSLALIVFSYYMAKWFNESVIKSITNFYKYDFPYVIIKAESGEVEGQLIDILDKYIITLSENGILKMIQWDKIEIMEIGQKNENKHCI